nr:MAG TPA: hypothetical protein [Caudoviricetes sp.]
MFLKLKVHCTCNCNYYVNEQINTEKVICPNCGKEHPSSSQIISMLHVAKRIDDGNVPGADTVRTFAVSKREDSDC